MIKKIIALIAVLVLVFSFTAFADDEIYVYGEDDIDYLCNALNMDDCEIIHYCEENNITYFAVNKDNTKQIKRSEVSDDFSTSVVDFALLDDEKILEFSAELSGFSDAEPQVVNFNEFKILKYEVKTTDSGGEYILTQFITVKDAKKIVLSFCTDVNLERDYIDPIFEEQFTVAKEKNYKPFVIAGVVLFTLVAAGSAWLIIKDLRTKEE